MKSTAHLACFCFSYPKNTSFALQAKITVAALVQCCLMFFFGLVFEQLSQDKTTKGSRRCFCCCWNWPFRSEKVCSGITCLDFTTTVSRNWNGTETELLSKPSRNYYVWKLLFTDILYDQLSRFKGRSFILLQKNWGSNDGHGWLKLPVTKRFRWKVLG